MPKLLEALSSVRRPSKKDVERRQLEQFRQLLGDFPAGEIVSLEEPDFVVHASRRIGIELTALHSFTPGASNRRQAQETYRRAVVAEAHRLYEEGGGPPLDVSVLFAGAPLGKADVTLVARNLASLIRNNAPGQGQVWAEEYDWVDRNRMPEQIQRVRAFGLAYGSKSFFGCPTTGWIPELQSVDIQRVIDSKNLKYDAYLRRCEEAWLLVTCNSSFSATWFTNPEIAASLPLKTTFDRVFLLSEFEGKVIELPVFKSVGA